MSPPRPPRNARPILRRFWTCCTCVSQAWQGGSTALVPAAADGRGCGDGRGLGGAGCPPLVACVFLTPPKAQALYVGKLAVHPDHQGGRGGYARVLLDHAADEARARGGLPALELQTRVELVENHLAFRAMGGFEKTGETAYDGFDRPTSFTFRRPV